MDNKEYYAFPTRIILEADRQKHRRGEFSVEKLKKRDEYFLVYANHIRSAKRGLSPIVGDNDKAQIYSTILIVWDSR